VVVPTLESAGTNVKMLEALAMGRAVVSTSSGAAGGGGGGGGVGGGGGGGLDCEHGRERLDRDTPEDFARGIESVVGG